MNNTCHVLCLRETQHPTELGCRTPTRALHPEGGWKKTWCSAKMQNLRRILLARGALFDARDIFPGYWFVPLRSRMNPRCRGLSWGRRPSFPSRKKERVHVR